MGKKRLSVIWLIPILALLMGGWLTFRHLEEEGTVVTIVFDSAEGIAAGKTEIRYRDVSVGMVEDISFSDDLSRVIVTATLNREMRDHLGEDTRFWVVRARLSVNEIQALGTLLSGVYIGMDPGEGGGSGRTAFEGLENPPVLLADDQGSRFVLHSDSLYSYDIGVPVYYRHMQVGEIIDYRLEDNGQSFTIELFVKAPFDKLVHDNTAFWNAGGLDVKLGADGVEVDSQSLVSILIGGVAFDNIEQSPGEQATSGSEFTLHARRADAVVASRAELREYRLYFDGSARGLNVDAPVTLRGITVGRVTDVALEYHKKLASFRIPVMVEVDSKKIRVVEEGATGLDTMDDQLLVDFGMRAQLRSGNLVTGQLLVDFDFYPDAEPAELLFEDGYTVLPTVPSPLDALKQSLIGFLDRVNEIPIERMISNLDQVLVEVRELVASANALVESADLAATLEKINGLVSDADALVNSADLGSTLASVREATGRLESAMGQAETMFAAYGEDSALYQQAVKMLEELSLATRSLRQMADYIERHPEALLKGKTR